MIHLFCLFFLCCGTHVHVGTSYGSKDIVADGTVDFVYIRNLHFRVVPSNRVTWYFTSVTNEILEVERVYAIARPMNSSVLNSTCTVSHSNSTFQVSNQSVPFTMDFDCTDGLTIIDVVIEILPRTLLSVSFEKQTGSYQPAFSVGTWPTYSDVVADSVALPLWDPFSSVKSFEEDEYETKFYFYQTSRLNQTFGPPEVFADGLNFTLTGDASQGGVLIPNTSQALFIHFDCVVVEDVQILMKIPIPNFVPVYFSFWKSCKTPDVPINIGTYLDSTNVTAKDVVHRGSTAIMWRPKFGNAFRQAYQMEAVFYIQISPGEFNLNASVQVQSNGKECSPFIRDPIRVITPYPQLIIVVYNCTSPIQVHNTINVSVTMEGVLLPIQFAWKKNVMLYQAPLNLGLTPDCDDRVIQSGSVSLEFQPLLYTYFLNGANEMMNIYFSLAPNSPFPSIVVKDITILMISNAANCTVLIPNFHPFTVTNRSCLNQTILHGCTLGGKMSVVSIFLRFDYFDPLQFYYQKFSGGQARGLSVGKLPGQTDVVNDGISLPLWNPNIFGSGNGFYRSSGTVLSETFYIFRSLESFFDQKFNLSLITSIPSHLSGTTSGLLTGNAINFTVNYDCSGPLQSHVKIRINLVPFDLVEFEWAKQCGLLLSLIDIGTTPGGVDIVNQGVSQPGWRSTATTRQFTGANATMGIRLWFVLEPSGAHEIAVANVSVNALNNSLCQPYLNNSISNISVSEYSYLDVIYNCQANEGFALFTFNMTFQEDYLPINLRWKKGLGGLRRGFTIGLLPDSTDVVQDGVPQGNWASGGHMVPASVTHIGLYLYTMPQPDYLNGLQIINSIQIENMDGIFVNYTIPSMLITPDPKHMVISFDCVVQEATPMKLVFELEGFESLSLMIVKVCPPYDTQVKVGTSAFSDDVVFEGNATSEWSFKDHTASVDGNSFASSFYIQTTQVGYQIPVSYSVTTSRSDCNPSLNAPSKITDNPTQPITVTYNCQIPGETVITLYVLYLVEESVTSIAFRWSKITGGSTRLGLNVGSTPLGSDVVQNGIVNPDWKSEFARITIPKQRRSLESSSIGHIETNWSWSNTFYFSISSTSTSNEPQSFAPVTIEAQKQGLCLLSLSGPAVKGGVVSLDSRDLFVSVTYQCSNSPSSVSIYATMPIFPFDNLHWRWTKESNGAQLAFFVTANLTGFETTTDPNVVTNSQVNPFWGAHVSKAIATTQFPNVIFYYGMENHPDRELFPIGSVANITASSIQIDSCVIKIDGNGSDGGVIGGRGQIVRSVILEFSKECGNEPLDFQVTIQFTNFAPISFFFFRDIYVLPSAPFPSWAVISIILGAIFLIFLIIAGLNYYIVGRFENQTKKGENKFKIPATDVFLIHTIPTEPPF